MRGDNSTWVSDIHLTRVTSLGLPSLSLTRRPKTSITFYSFSIIRRFLTRKIIIITNENDQEVISCSLICTFFFFFFEPNLLLTNQMKCTLVQVINFDLNQSFGFCSKQHHDLQCSVIIIITSRALSPIVTYL